MGKEYLHDPRKVLEDLNTGESGLTSEEVARRQAQYGANKLAEGNKKTKLQRFLEQLKDPMLIMLIIAAGVSAVTNIISGESMVEVFIIIVVVLINAILGVLQESKAEEAIEALQTMTAATCKVIRDGKQQVIPSAELVPGDIVVLEAGDAVPADGRLISAASLKIEESALTGESVPVNKLIDILNLGDGKDVPLGDRVNMCYMGSTVVYGRGIAVITATGMDTEMGKIADALNQTQEELTPLQIKLNELGKKLSYLVLLICVFIFVFDLLVSKDMSLKSILEIFMVAVSLAVAAIPEGLATVVTVVLSIGVTKMSKENAVVRRLTAVETLGCTQIICSDKTGTLTQNKMTVTEHVGDGRQIATAMALCCDAILNDKDEAEGEPTEAALVNFAVKQGLKKYELEIAYPRVNECPFDSSRKMMSTIHKTEEGYVQFTKGAPDVILSRCTSYFDGEKEVPFTDELKAKFLADNKAMADKALRVLAVSKRDWSENPENNSSENLEHDLCLIGLTGMIDPIRPEVKDAIVECRKAGIRPIMITGDHKDTAVAIAKDLGIIEDASAAITIGIGMGITGTDVTKNVSDMILADDNFATIVNAVEEGRRIYDNIRKAIQFLLSSNMSEVLGIFFATLLGFTLLKPVHLLFINLITDAFPALALGLEKEEPDTMRRPPRDSKDSIFAGGMVFDIVYQGLMITVLTIASYIIGHSMEVGYFEMPKGLSPDGMTMAFMTMNMCEIFQSLNMRSQRASIFRLNYQNKALFGTMVMSLVFVTLVIEVPLIANMFGFTSVSLTEYAIALGLSVLVIPIVECVKFVQRRLRG